MHSEVGKLHAVNVDAETEVAAGNRSRMSWLFKKFAGLGFLFHVCVTAPTLLAIVYFGFLASDVYISEARFVVRSPNKPETTGFGVLLKTVGFSNAGDEIYASNIYMTSRDALRDLNRNNAVASAYGAKSVSIFDRFNPLGLFGSFEDLYKYFIKKVVVEYDSSTSITTLQVRAYTAADAQRINKALLEHAEALVNRLNNRARTDLIASAEREVTLSREDVRKASVALSRYRDREGMIDPEKESEAKLQMISKLQDQLIASRVQLNQVKTFAPDSSEIVALRSRISELESSINSEMGRIAGGSKSLSRAAVEYERLKLDSEFADKKLGVALTSYEEARSDARRKQAYVERIVNPALPDDAEEPHRLRGIFAALVLGLIAWGILSMLLSSLKDHVE